MKTSDDLKALLQRIDHKGYPTYKDTRGSYRFDGYVLNIDHVQGDPFASPSKLSAVIPGSTAGFPSSLFDLPHKRIALQDHLTRLFAKKLESFNFKAKGSGKSGLISVSRCGQEILSRTALSMDPSSGNLSVHFEVGFPARGRTIAAFELIKILFDFLPECVRSSFYYNRLNKRVIKEVADLSEDQQYIREQLPKLGLCAFVAGSVLSLVHTDWFLLHSNRRRSNRSWTNSSILFQLPYCWPDKSSALKSDMPRHSSTVKRVSRYSHRKG